MSDEPRTPEARGTELDPTANIASSAIEDTAAPARVGIRAHAWPIFGFLILTAFFLWPAVRHLRTQVIGAGDDSSVFLWVFWSFPRALLRGENPFVSQHLFHPVGVNLAFNTNAPLEALLSWPLARAFGLGGAANFLQLAAGFLSAFGAYLLALHVTKNRGAAFFAGVAFAFAPYRFFHAQGHFNLIHTELLAFGAYACLLLYERPSRKRALGVGVVLGLTFLIDLYFAAFLLVILAIVAAWKWRETFSRELAMRWGQAGIVALVLAGPLAVPMLGAYRDGEAAHFEGLGGAERFSSDLLSWVVPPPWHPVFDRWTAEPWQSIAGGREGLAYPGITVLVLGAIGVIAAGKGRRGLWTLLAAVAALLAFGPFLHVNGKTGGAFTYLGHRFSVPLPFMIFHRVPLLSFIRAPGRFAIPAMLALDVLAACALARYRERAPRAGAAVLGVTTALIIFEFLPGIYPTVPARFPAAYEAVAAQKDPGAVLDLPLQWKTGIASYGETDPARDYSTAMYYATGHGKPIVGGYVSHYPQHRLAELFSYNVYRQLMALQQDPHFHSDPGFTRPAAFTVDDLRELGIGYIVCRRVERSARACAYVESLKMPVLADDGMFVAWKVPPETE